MTLLLGGSASPLGWSVQFLDVPLDDAVAAVRDVHSAHPCEVSSPRPFEDALAALAPFQAPWTREVLAPCGPWTAYLNNGLHGGDPTAVGPAVARALGATWVMAMHTPTYGPGHQSTQLWVQGPDGEPPLMSRRTLSAHAQDGRWSWHQSGAAYPFEQTERYGVRRIRDRFDRPLLVTYLQELGIPVDDPGAYGDGVVLQQVVPWTSRAMTLDEARAEIVV